MRSLVSKSRWLVLALMFGVCAACSPEYGFVKGKWDVPAHTEYTWQSIGCGPDCEIDIPIPHHVDRACYIHIEGEGGNGDRQLECWQWGDIEVGQWTDWR